MKYRTLAVLAFAGALGFSGAAFAEVNININIDTVPRIIAAKPQPQKLPPKVAQPKRPEMPQVKSRDMRDMKRPPEPPKVSRDKKPPMKDKKPPMKDNRMPQPPKPHSRDKRPPEFRK